MKKLGLIFLTVILIAGGFYFIKQKGLAPSSSETPLATEPTMDQTFEKKQSAKKQKHASETTTPGQNCFAFEYRHTDEAKSKDIEDFLDYSNAFPIEHAGVNPKSVCVRVNQKSVPFQIVKGKNKKEEIMIGSVVGPESVIRVSYCIGKAHCQEACPKAKKRFMDDMMSGSLDDDINVSDDVKSKAKELRALASENQGLNDHSIMRTWVTLKTQEWNCKK